MILTDLTNRGAMPLLEWTLAFTEARHRVIVENVANIDTPGYRTRQLDPRSFQAALRDATRRRDASGADSPRLRATRQVREAAPGRLEFRPATESPENVLFHDGTNARVERQMSQLAENAIAHQLAVELVKRRFDGIMQAIRGRVT